MGKGSIRLLSCALPVLVVAAGVTTAQASTGGTLGRWTGANGITGSCFGGGGQCMMGGGVGAGDCHETSGLSCSGTLNQVTTTGAADTCSGTGTTTFVYTSSTLGSSRSIPVTVTMASGVVTVDGSDGFLTVHATFNAFCIPVVSFVTTFWTTWSGVVSFASTS